MAIVFLGSISPCYANDNVIGTISAEVVEVSVIKDEDMLTYASADPLPVYVPVRIEPPDCDTVMNGNCK